MKTFADLVRRYTEAQGIPFHELAAAHGMVVPSEASRTKHLQGTWFN